MKDKDQNEYTDDIQEDDASFEDEDTGALYDGEDPNGARMEEPAQTGGADGDESEGEAPPPEDEAALAKRKRRTILLNVLLAVCICGVVVAIVMLVIIFQRYQVASNEYEGLQRSYAPAVSEEEGPRFIDLAALRAVNPECIGWIEIPDTGIDYPLLHSPDDNIKYLEVTFEEIWNPSGAIFMDMGNSPGLTDVNTLIYGHNMKDGSMFAGIASFMREDHLNAHKEILIYTDEGIRHYEVFAARTVRTTDRPMSTWFDGAEDEAAYLAEMGAGSIELSPDDRIITLVTCVNSYDSSDQRYIVQAVFRSLEEMPEPASSTSSSGSSSSSG